MERPPKNRSTVKMGVGCAVIVLILVLGKSEAYQKNTYFDLNCGRMERRIIAFHRTIRSQPVESETATLYEKYVGSLPETCDWRVAYSGGYNIFGGKVIFYSLNFESLPGYMNTVLPRWFDDNNYPDGHGINEYGLTDRAKGEVILRTLEAARKGGRGNDGIDYMTLAQSAVQWITHVADVDDLPTVDETLDDKLWKKRWVPQIEEWKSAYEAVSNPEGFPYRR